ncbi:transposase family protein [Streptomyces canus]|uniref:transposase family protein n=1 Tax=Streptomyces canus TaxID=58343 RepID=UPI0027D7EE22|nr:transposase family protein [Streptomyces canus]
MGGDHFLGALADLGFLGVDKPDDPEDLVIVTGFKATRYRKLTPGQKEANHVLAAGRAPVEHGFAHLKNWRVLTKLRADHARATQLLRALLVLTNLEVSRCDNAARNARRSSGAFPLWPRIPGTALTCQNTAPVKRKGARACAHGASTTTPDSCLGKNSPARVSSLRQSATTWR